MLDKALLDSSSSLNDFQIELTEEFNNFSRYVEDCSKFNDSIKEHFEKFKSNFDKTEAHENALKRRIEEEFNRNKKREKESTNLILQIKENYDRNIGRLRDHQHKQISNIIEKHKLEIQKWKSKYEKVKFDKKVEHIDCDEALIDKKFYQNKIDELNAELASLTSKNHLKEQELSNIKKEKKSVQGELNDFQKDVSKLQGQVHAKDAEINEMKFKIKELQAKVKDNENLLKDKTEKLKSKANEIEELKLRCQKLSDDCAKFNADKSSKDEAKNMLSDVEELKQNHKEELTLVKCELNTANRALERKTDVCNYFRREVNELKSKISQYEDMVNMEKKNNSQQLQQIQRYQSDLKQKQSEVVDKEEEIMKLKLTKDEHSNNLDLKLKELDDAKKNEKKWKNKCVEFEKKHQTLLTEIECIKRKNAALKVELDQIKNQRDQLNFENNKLTKSYEALKKVCKDLENQLSKCTQKITDQSSAKKSYIQKTTASNNEANTCRNELSLSLLKNEKLTEEIEQLEKQLANKDYDFKNKLTDEIIKYNKLCHEHEILIDTNHRQEDRISWLQTNVDECDKQLAQLANENTLLSKELSSIKEEATKHITMISNLRNEKKNLLKDMQEQFQQIETFQKAINEMEVCLKSKDEELNREKYTLREKDSQHSKLIDMLISNKPEKKKPFIFSMNSKTAPDFVDFDQAHKALKAQRQKNAELNEQLSKALLDLDQKACEVEYLNTQVNELKNQLVQKITNCPKKSFAAHDIPHNFVPTKVKLTTLCVSCANTIYFGQKAKKCQDCQSTVHLNCSLVNNCGVPVDCVRKVIHENDYPSSDAVSQMSEASNVEPSAPEAEFSSEEINEKDLELQLNLILDKTSDSDEEFSSITSSILH